LAWAAANPEGCAAAGRRARERAEQFRWESVLDRYDDIFRRIGAPGE
jgi:glycosyltransferase involved in cell wall biosynthesis